MMKYTETFFKFPFKVFDEKEGEKLFFKQQQKLRGGTAVGDDGEEMEKPRWAAGWARVPFHEIVAWHDDCTEYKTVEEIAENGWDSTFVITSTLGQFECLWDRKKFEQKLDTAYEEYLIKANELQSGSETGGLDSQSNNS